MKNSVTVGVLCRLIFYDVHQRTVYKKISIKSQMFRKFNISLDKKNCQNLITPGKDFQNSLVPKTLNPL